MELTVQEWLFVGSYLRDGNAAKAFRYACPEYTGNHVYSLAWDWVRKPHIKAEIEKTRAAVASGEMGITKEMVRQDIVSVLRADPREFVNVQTGACRHCHGIDHLFQRTRGEMERDRFAAEMDSKPFDPMGGIGFDAYADPHPDCPECNGKGVDRVRLTDTRTLSADAACLLQSIEQTKHGVKITTRSKDVAREAAARLLGMNKDTLEVTGSLKIEDMTDEQLAALVEKELKK